MIVFVGTGSVISPSMRLTVHMYCCHVIMVIYQSHNILNILVRFGLLPVSGKNTLEMISFILQGERPNTLHCNINICIYLYCILQMAKSYLHMDLKFLDQFLIKLNINHLGPVVQTVTCFAFRNT